MKSSFTHYYVQSQEKDKLPEIVHHTKDDKTGEYFYKFVDKGKAKALLAAEKKITPNTQFRIVKLVETYDAGAWV